MKPLLVSALLLLAPFAAHAACAQTDFEIRDFKSEVTGSGTTLQLSVSGELVNHCAVAAAARVRVDAKDSGGKVVQSRQSWPAGTTNIAPGASTKFNLGKQFHVQTDMALYTASVVSVRTW